MSTFRAPGSTRPRSKILSGVGLVLALLASLIAFAPAAFAHHANLSGSWQCDTDTGEYVVTWTIHHPDESWNDPVESSYSGWPPRATAKDMVIDSTDPTVSFSSTTLAPGESATATQQLAGSTSGWQELDVDVHWEWEERDFGDQDYYPVSGHYRTESAKVELDGDCDQEVIPEDPEVTLSKECEVPDKLHVPNTEGVTYLLDGDDVSGETLEGPLSGTLTAEADEGYELTEEWSYPFDLGVGDPCPEEVTPEDPEVTLSKECEVPDKLHVPNTEGVIYLLDGDDVSGETLEGPLSGTLTAEADEGYELTEEWSYPFDLGVGDPCPEEVTPVDPEVNQSEQCEVEGTLVIPDVGGVFYLLDTGEGPEKVVGELTGPISGTLSVEAQEGHVLVGDDAFPMEIDIAAAEDCPPPPPPPEDDPVTSASLSYVCDADGTVTFSSTDGASDFVVEVDGSVVYDQSLEGEETLPLTIEGTTSVIVRADGVVLVNEDVVFEACDDGEVGGIGEEAPGEETVVEGTEEEPPASAPASLPRTGISAGILAMVAALTMGFGATLRAASRRLR
ncbi:MAG: hypothetical protein U5K29_02995 [Acidimicrobiales bacterium]|nr:hypothetical protein [Acidimicrobiales bacterium]